MRAEQPFAAVFFMIWRVPTGQTIYCPFFLTRDMPISQFLDEYLFVCVQWCPVTDNRPAPNRHGHDVSGVLQVYET
jgi:hypothetical protein